MPQRHFPFLGGIRFIRVSPFFYFQKGMNKFKKTLAKPPIGRYSTIRKRQEHSTKGEAKMANKIKFEKIYDEDGYLDGYKLGTHYLLKIPTWGNGYCWGINTTGRLHVYACEEDTNEYVFSCKEGKARLIELEGLN